MTPQTHCWQSDTTKNPLRKHYCVDPHWQKCYWGWDEQRINLLQKPCHRWRMVHLWQEALNHTLITRDKWKGMKGNKQINYMRDNGVRDKNKLTGNPAVKKQSSDFLSEVNSAVHTQEVRVLTDGYLAVSWDIQRSWMWAYWVMKVEQVLLKHQNHDILVIRIKQSFNHMKSY